MRKKRVQCNILGFFPLLQMPVHRIVCAHTHMHIHTLEVHAWWLFLCCWFVSFLDSPIFSLHAKSYKCGQCCTYIMDIWSQSFMWAVSSPKPLPPFLIITILTAFRTHINLHTIPSSRSLITFTKTLYSIQLAGTGFSDLEFAGFGALF